MHLMPREGTETDSGLDTAPEDVQMHLMPREGTETDSGLDISRGRTNASYAP